MGNSFKLVELRICLVPDLNAEVWRVQLCVCVPETKDQHTGVHSAVECVCHSWTDVVGAPRVLLYTH